MSLSSIRAVEQGQFGPRCYWYEHSDECVHICQDDTISFVTKSGRRIDDAHVLEIDLGGAFPIRVEWDGPGHGKRIERFHVDEFVEFWKE